MGITMRTAIVPDRIPLPGQPLRMRLRLWSERPITLSYVSYLNADGASRRPARLGDQGRLERPRVDVPGLHEVPGPDHLVPGDRDQRRARSSTASVIFDKIEIDSSAEVEIAADLRTCARTRCSRPDGKAEGDWSFATLSDIQFTAASPDLAKTGIAALNRIRATDPDLVVLNGDITDLGGVGRSQARARDARDRRLRSDRGRAARRTAIPRPCLATTCRATTSPTRASRPGHAGELGGRVRRSRTARSTTRARGSSCSTRRSATLRFVGLRAAADASRPRSTTPRRTPGSTT